MSDSSLPSRWRFSLRTLLGCTVILALVITVWMQWRELSRLREEVKVLRAEGGHLAIDDATLVYASEVEVPQDDHWRWRVHVPATARYQLCLQQGEIPQDGLPIKTSQRLTFAIEPGEHRLDFLIEFEGGDLPRHVAYLSTPNGRLGMIELFQKAQLWLDTPGSLTNRLAEATSLGRATRRFGPEEPAVLLRYRAQEVELVEEGTGKLQQRFRTPSTPSDGLMLWIERIP